MSQTNFCRQAKAQFLKMLEEDRTREPGNILEHTVSLIDAAQKFVVPEGGRLLDDNEFRALEGIEELRLPYPVVAIEYHRRNSVLREGEVRCPKAIVLAREHDTGDGRGIVLLPIFWREDVKFSGFPDGWSLLPEVCIPSTDFLGTVNSKGFREFVVVQSSPLPVPLSDYADEVGALMSFLNALACSNVRAELMPKKNKQKDKSARHIPFDDYHILTIDVPRRSISNGAQNMGHHASPREHLRRGHVRRLESGRCVWVNAAIVNAGRGFARVDKSYVVRGVQ